MASAAFERVLIATDDERILDAATRFGAEGRMTAATCQSGTDRAAELVRSLPDVTHVVNVQGDEPLIPRLALALLASKLTEADVPVGTLVRPLDDLERENPSVVKAVLNVRGDALYFSRADIPFARAAGTVPKRYAHMGVYGYQRQTLLRLSSLAPTPLERAEGLEQLRALENGIPITCFVTAHRSVGVDTPEDLARAEVMMRLASA